MREAASIAMSATCARSSRERLVLLALHLLARARQDLLGVAARLRLQLGAQRLGVLRRAREHLVALAAGAAQQLLVLRERGLGVGRGLLGRVDLLADRLLAVVDDLEQRAPGELREDPREHGEGDEGGDEERAVHTHQLPPAPPSAAASRPAT